MGSLGVVIVGPGGNCLTGMGQAREQRLVQELIAHPAVEALHGAVLGRLSRRDVGVTP